MNKLQIIISDTLLDQLKRRSFYVLLAVSVLLVLTIRSCYNVNYSINNQIVDPETIAWHASLFAFHLVGGLVLFMAVLLSMRLFKNDRHDGTMIFYLSRSVARWQYGLGRVAGVWLLSSMFMFCLHATIFFIVWSKSGEILPGYLIASLLCTINILFVILLTSILSFFMPGFICAMTVMAGVSLGFLSDGGHRILSSHVVKSMLMDSSTAAPSLWRSLYPKLLMVQEYAATFISHDYFQAFGPVHPVVNVLFYNAILCILFLLIVNRQEV